MAHPTIMQPRGIELLRPIWKLITDESYLNLSFNDFFHLKELSWHLSMNVSMNHLMNLSFFNDIKVYYTKYVNNHKHTIAHGERSIDDAVEAGLTPGT